jgi:hypothetical protein
MAVHMNKKIAKLLKKSVIGSSRKKQREILDIYKKAPWNKREEIKNKIRELVK